MSAARVVEISERGRRLSLDRGFLVVHGEGAELGRVAVDDVSALIIDVSGVTYSNPLLVALAERGAVIAVCGPKFVPTAWVLPVVGHYAQTRIMTAQAAASSALKRQIWKAIVQAKVRGQADALEAVGVDASKLRAYAARVRTGDAENVEGHAAARYWPALFGPGFKRDREATGPNELLNYGYTVLRSLTARAIVSAGLHPSLSLKHRRDPLALADDLMEPLRPIVDMGVKSMTEAGASELTRAVRSALVALLNEPLAGGGTAALRAHELATALAAAYVAGKVRWSGVARGSVRSANDNGGREKGRSRLQELSPEEGL